MTENSLALTVTLFAALLALVSGMVWLSYRKHQYLLWLSAALLLAAGGYIVQESVDITHTWRVGLVSVLSLLAAVASVQAMVMRLGRRQMPSAVLVGVMLFALGVVSAYGEPAMNQWQCLLVAVGTGVILGQVLLVAWHTPLRHRTEHILMGVYTLFCIFAVLSPWGWGRTEWWTHLMSGALVLLGAALLPIVLIMCVMFDGVPSSRSTRDETTGLLTAEAFAAACGEKPLEQKITVLMLCSLDQLHLLRERLGSKAADRILAQFAQLLQANVRDGDWLARTGSEEFGIALRNIEVADARRLLQRIQQELDKKTSWHAHAETLQLSACFGMVSVQERESFERVLHRAYVLLSLARDAGSKHLGFEEQSYERIVQLA